MGFKVIFCITSITIAVRNIVFSLGLICLQIFGVNCIVFQITEQIKSLHQEKLQPYKIEIAKDDARALKLVSEFEATIYTPAVVCVQLLLGTYFCLQCLSSGASKVLKALLHWEGLCVFSADCTRIFTRFFFLNPCRLLFAVLRM